MHTGSRSVVSKIMKLGYYCPSMHIDAKALIHRCEACQIHSSVPRKTKQDMTSITSAWPFSQWGIDIVRPLPIALGSARFLVVAIDYFRKWVKAKPLEYSHSFAKDSVYSNPLPWSTIRKPMDKYRLQTRTSSKVWSEGWLGRRVTTGTYVLRLNSASKTVPRNNETNVGRAYVVRKSYRDEAYKLETLFGSPVDRTWNGSNLRLCSKPSGLRRSNLQPYVTIEGLLVKTLVVDAYFVLATLEP
ncbi:reverse transcriptase domain-containing protein [Tanacetum coccineum]|uniref:Reverse transcriptase domain-containing protein n=1 Tax=Tanacetum coccineum TaxID=301880 RepID=A0ABQ5HT71_9ASTR